MKLKVENRRITYSLPLCFLGLQVSVVGLERALHQYTLEPSEAEFDMKSVPLATQPLAEQKGKALQTSLSLTLKFGNFIFA